MPLTSTLIPLCAIAIGVLFYADVDPELLIDMVYGRIYYRLLVGHQKLDKRFGDALVDRAMAGVKSSPSAPPPRAPRRLL